MHSSYRTHFINKQTTFALVVLVAASACSSDQAQLRYAASIEPAGMILRELVGDRAEVRVLLPPGASPHHYEPKPSDARFAEDAFATFYFDNEVDGWAARLGDERAISISGVEHSETREHVHNNPHIWLDPIAVQRCIPELLNALIELDPEGTTIYQANADRFSESLKRLDKDIQETLKDAKDKAVIQAHPSWNLFFDRYGIRVVGVLESTPGASLPPRQFAKLVDTVSSGDVFAIIAEPQLARAPLETLAAGKVPIIELDPLGGGTDRYEELIRSSAERIAEVAS